MVLLDGSRWVTDSGFFFFNFFFLLRLLDNSGGFVVGVSWVEAKRG